jgi:hypothetical protein
MPIRYDINPELNLVIYVCKGEITAVDLFHTSDVVLSDPRRKPGLTAIYDMFFAVENIQLEDMDQAIRRLERAAEPDSGVGPRVLLTRSDGIHLLVKTMKLLPSNPPIQIEAFHTIEEAIVALGLMNVHDKTVQFWQECNLRYETT